jgi:hypothetical protein
MAWITYEKLNHRTCYIGRVLFVKGPAKRRKRANLCLNASLWIEAQLHIEEDMKLRLHKMNKKWNQSRFECGSESDPWRRTYCNAVHLSVYVHNNKLYSKSKNELHEFNNQWLFNQIMRKAFE